ncbi:MAG: CerR family C-terminal domain-containing protein [Desulfovibrionaceae bacterium]|nr:CerR family C-terminal domain-containing protein [Desulfovibrionaceae bacterium]
MADSGNGEDTRVRLLHAAGDIFSRKGYQGATIRDICRKAKANVAAVHYHFGNKERLYEAVLRHAHEDALSRFPVDMGLSGASTPRERLSAYVRALLLRMLSKGENAWHGALMARELAEPTPMLGRFVDRSILPRMEKLREIVSDILGPGADAALVGLCVQSIVGQCRNYAVARPILVRLFPDLTYDDSGITRLAEHIVRFSVAAMAHYHDRQDEGLGAETAHAIPSRPDSHVRQ